MRSTLQKDNYLLFKVLNRYILYDRICSFILYPLLIWLPYLSLLATFAFWGRVGYVPLLFLLLIMSDFVAFVLLWSPCKVTYNVHLQTLLTLWVRRRWPLLYIYGKRKFYTKYFTVRRQRKLWKCILWHS